MKKLKALLTPLALGLVLLVAGGTPVNADVVCAGVDDTAVIQAEINAKKFSGGLVQLPVGTCAVSSLDLTQATGMTLRGHGRNVTILLPIQSGVHVLDLTDAYFVTLSDFTLGHYQQPVVPKTGIFMAAGVFNNNNVNTVERLFVSGRWQYAALYIQGACCGSVRDSEFWNYESSNVANTVVLTDGGLTSAFAPNATGAIPPNIWSFFAVEMHSMSGTAALLTWHSGWTTLVGVALFSPDCVATFVGSHDITLLGIHISSDVPGTARWC